MGSWVPCGYRKSAVDRRRLEQEEETAPVVRQIFRRRAEEQPGAAAPRPAGEGTEGRPEAGV